MPPDMATQPGQARERERSDKDREREKSNKSDQAQASGSSSSSQRVGNYRLDAEIGRGSFATVYLGYKSVSHLHTLGDLELTASSPSMISPSYTLVTLYLSSLQTEINHPYRSQGGVSPKANRQTTREPRERNKYPQVDTSAQYSSPARLLRT